MLAERYHAIRDQIRSGDCVLWRSRGLLPRLIRLWSDYSHASLIVRLDEYEGLQNRVFLVETLKRGLSLTLLSKRLSDTDGDAWLFQPEGLGDEQIAALRASALVNAAKGARYDFKGLLANMFGRVSLDVRRYFCSEHVWHEWKQAGVLRPLALTETGTRKVSRGLAPRPGDIPRWLRGTLIDLKPADPAPAKAPPPEKPHTRKEIPCH